MKIPLGKTELGVAAGLYCCAMSWSLLLKLLSDTPVRAGGKVPLAELNASVGDDITMIVQE